MILGNLRGVDGGKLRTRKHASSCPLPPATCRSRFSAAGTSHDGLCASSAAEVPPGSIFSTRPAGRLMRTSRSPLPAFAVAGGIASHPLDEAPQSSQRPVTMAKGGANFGSGGGSRGATLERSKLSFVMPTPVVQSPKLDDGGSGGDIGKHNHNGGGGGDDGGDDDDYFADGDDDGEGGDGENKSDGFMRTVIPESYDKLSIAAVFAEWMRTVADLPLILRRSVEMGLFSSAQLVRFFSMDVRPNITRSISRSLPPTVAREFVGRLMADPGFAQKLVLESMFAASASLLYEFRARGDRLGQELDLAMINTLGMASATAATVWLLAPTRSYGSVHKFPWQQMLDGLPNCVFDSSSPTRRYSRPARIGSFFAKMAELSAVGALAGSVTSLASAAAVEIRRRSSDPKFQPSVAVPELGRSSGGLAAFFAVNANIRYQLMGGLDRYLFGHTNFLWTYLGITGATRVASLAVGELSRPWWQGLPDPQQLASNWQPPPTVRRVSKKVSRKVPKQHHAVATAPAAAAAEPQLQQPAIVALSDLSDAGLVPALRATGAADGSEGAVSVGPRLEASAAAFSGRVLPGDDTAPVGPLSDRGSSRRQEEAEGWSLTAEAGITRSGPVAEAADYGMRQPGPAAGERVAYA